MEAVVERDHPEAVGVAGMVMVAAHHLEPGLDRLGPRVAEERGIREGRGDQPLGQLLLAGDVVEVRDVPQLAGLVLQRLDQMWMAVAERGDRDTGTEVQVTSAVAVHKVDTFAIDEGDVLARVGRHHRGKHLSAPWVFEVAGRHHAGPEKGKAGVSESAPRESTRKGPESRPFWGISRLGRPARPPPGRHRRESRTRRWDRQCRRRSRPGCRHRGRRGRGRHA